MITIELFTYLQIIVILFIPGAIVAYYGKYIVKKEKVRSFATIFIAISLFLLSIMWYLIILNIVIMPVEQEINSYPLWLGIIVLLFNWSAVLGILGGWFFAGIFLLGIIQELMILSGKVRVE